MPIRVLNSIPLRFHLFEFCDQAWLPDFIREGFQDCLSFIHRTYQPYELFANEISEWADGKEVLDLASGSGEQIGNLIRASYSKTDNLKLSFTLSDLFPQKEAYENLQDIYGAERVKYLDSPLAFSQLNNVTFEYWTIFTALHHLEPHAVKELFTTAQLKCKGFCVVELSSRRLSDLIGMMCGFFSNMIVPLFAKEFKFKKLFFSTFIPLIPFMVSFDGVVSVLRSYTADEIRELLPENFLAEFEMLELKRSWGFGMLESTAWIFQRRP